MEFPPKMVRVFFMFFIHTAVSDPYFHMYRPSIRPLFQNQAKQIFTEDRTLGWPSGSLTTSVILHLFCKKTSKMSSFI